MAPPIPPLHLPAATAVDTTTPTVVEVSLPGTGRIKSQRLKVKAAAQDDKQEVLIIELNEDSYARKYLGVECHFRGY